MKIVSSVIIISTLLTLASCSVEKKMSATGGSKADGIVKMSYEVGPFEQATVDKAQGSRSALKRCKAWGYKKVEPFEASSKKCIDQPNCMRYIVTTEYQCLN